MGTRARVIGRGTQETGRGRAFFDTGPTLPGVVYRYSDGAIIPDIRPIEDYSSVVLGYPIDYFSLRLLYTSSTYGHAQSRPVPPSFSTYLRTLRVDTKLVLKKEHNDNNH